MLLRFTLIASIGLAVVMSGFFDRLFNFFWQDQDSENAQEEIIAPWIEVLKPGVFLNNGLAKKELKTGDAIAAKNTLAANEKGLAIIHLGDGSSLKIYPNSQLSVDDAYFDQQSKKLNFKIKLLFGRVWSRIISLTTPDSYWEVQTGNAVAAVRGTAFGVEYQAGQSQIIGSREKVSVKIIDPQTQETVQQTEFTVAANQYLAIKDEDVSKITSAKVAAPQISGSQVAEKILTVQNITPQIKAADWVKTEMEIDVQLPVQLPAAEPVSPSPQPEAFSGTNKIKEFFKDYLLPKASQPTEPQKILDSVSSVKEPVSQTYEEIKASVSPSLSPSASPSLIQSTTDSSLQKSIAPTTLTKKYVRDLTMEIIKGNLSINVIEGERISLKAVATMSDGSKVDVTSKAQWKVLGQIGKMELPGIFFAQLDPSLSEVGISLGNVIATFTDPANNSAFLAQTPFFNVEAKIDALDILNTDG